jgi:hypothetical protein
VSLNARRDRRAPRGVPDDARSIAKRCPAIIGQAHLLYHARAGNTRCHAEQSLTQLRSDAQDLFAAIADAEAEMKAARV